MTVNIDNDVDRVDWVEAKASLAGDEAFKALVRAGILSQVNVGRQCNRAFEAPAIIDAFTSFERGLASPTGNIRSAPPLRAVSSRPAG